MSNTFNTRLIKSTDEIQIGDVMIYTGSPRGTGIFFPDPGTRWPMETQNDIIQVSIQIIERGRGWWPEIKPESE